MRREGGLYVGPIKIAGISLADDSLTSPSLHFCFNEIVAYSDSTPFKASRKLEKKVCSHETYVKKITKLSRVIFYQKIEKFCSKSSEKYLKKFCGDPFLRREGVPVWRLGENSQKNFLKRFSDDFEQFFFLYRNFFDFFSF